MVTRVLMENSISTSQVSTCGVVNRWVDTVPGRLSVPSVS